MKHVIFVIHTLAIGGAERQISAVSNFLAEQGWKVSIVLIDNATVSFPVDDRVDVVCINQAIATVPDENQAPCRLFRLGKQPKLSLVDQWHIRTARTAQAKAYYDTYAYLKLHYALPLQKYLEQHPEAVVVSCMTIPNLSTMIAAKSLPNRVLFSDRTSPEYEYPADSLYVALKKVYYPRADAAVFQTPDARDYYTWLPQLEKYLVPNFIQGDRFPMRFEGERRQDIVNFCRLHPVKNIPLLIRAFSRIYQEYPGYTLTIYGEGTIREELECYAAERGLGGVVRFYDYDPHIHETVRDAAMFVSSSDREGISNSMLEAMAIGLPTVCTDCPAGGARITITPYKNGLLTPVGDEEALYKAMKELIENPTLAKELSVRAVEIKEELTLERIGQKWMDAITGRRNSDE